MNTRFETFLLVLLPLIVASKPDEIAKIVAGQSSEMGRRMQPDSTNSSSCMVPLAEAVVCYSDLSRCDVSAALFESCIGSLDVDGDSLTHHVFYLNEVFRKYQ